MMRTKESHRCIRGECVKRQLRQHLIQSHRHQDGDLEAVGASPIQNAIRLQACTCEPGGPFPIERFEESSLDLDIP